MAHPTFQDRSFAVLLRRAKERCSFSIPFRVYEDRRFRARLADRLAAEGTAPRDRNQYRRDCEQYAEPEPGDTRIWGVDDSQTYTSDAGWVRSDLVRN